MDAWLCIGKLNVGKEVSLMLRRVRASVSSVEKALEG